MQALNCLHPLEIVNPRYKCAEGYRPDDPYYTRQPDYKIVVPCGKCYLCRKKIANAWAFRLEEELDNPDVVANSYFLTFTFDNDAYKYYLHEDEHGKHINKSIVIRRWRQLFRKHTGISPRYFLVEDCGSQYGRIHLHGILIDPRDDLNKPISKKLIMSEQCFWRNGIVDCQPLHSKEAIGYICGYISGSSLDKQAEKHGKPICKKARYFIPRHFCSKGIGKKFAEKVSSEYQVKSKDHFLYKRGNYKLPIPRYLLSKIYDENYLDLLRTNNKIDLWLDRQRLIEQRRLGVRTYKGRVLSLEQQKQIQSTMDHIWGAPDLTINDINKDFNFYGKEFDLSPIQQKLSL